MRWSASPASPQVEGRTPAVGDEPVEKLFLASLGQLIPGLVALGLVPTAVGLLLGRAQRPQIWTKSRSDGRCANVTELVQIQKGSSIKYLSPPLTHLSTSSQSLQYFLLEGLR